ncbi:MAG: hypothetical protein K2I93_05485 [Oscillospiraceae bacterium]|nr:hypothetical protein [Oscillospiraceae bacterium]
MNPMSKMVQSNTPIGQLMGVLQGGASPQQLAQNILSNNPQAQKMLSSMQQQCGTRNPKDFVMETCRNNGIDQNQVMQLANMMGLK